MNESNFSNHIANETAFGYQIKQALNEGARQLDGEKLARLKAARQAAVAAHVEARPLAGLALATGGVSQQAGWMRLLGNLVPLAVLLAGLISISLYHSHQRAADLTEIDAAVLADDLPLNAYLDKGFGAFVKKQAE